MFLKDWVTIIELLANCHLKAFLNYRKVGMLEFSPVIFSDPQVE